MTRILVIEDEPNIADFVKRGLIHNGFDVDVASDGTAGLELAESHTPDLVILDLMLPDIDGIDVCRQLRGTGSMGVIILTARQLVGDRIRGLEAGADDYLPKPFAFEELLARIRAVLRRRSPNADEVIRVGNITIDPEKRQVLRGERLVELTNREFELLSLLARNAGRPLRREYIIQRVWGYDFEADSDPVKVYVNYLRRKLNDTGESDPIHAIRGFGYVMKESP